MYKITPILQISHCRLYSCSSMTSGAKTMFSCSQNLKLTLTKTFFHNEKLLLKYNKPRVELTGGGIVIHFQNCAFQLTSIKQHYAALYDFT